LHRLVTGKHGALSCQVTHYFRFYLKIGRTSVKALNINVEAKPLSTQEYPITLPMVNRSNVKGLMLTVYL